MRSAAKPNESSARDATIKDPAKYIALQAIRAEWGGLPVPSEIEFGNAIKLQSEKLSFKTWSPEAKRLWLQAFYAPTQRPLSEVKAEVAKLKRDGAIRKPSKPLW